MSEKQQYLSQEISHFDITKHNVVSLVEDMRNMAYSARDLCRAAEIFDRMLADTDCSVILCLAGSLVSAGLKKIVVDMIRNNMVDMIVSTGANIVDQDFFEALGFRHYVAEERLKAGMDDDQLRRLHIDRIYDTLIDENDLRVCDETITKIADDLEPRVYSSREFIREMGAYLGRQECTDSESIVLEAFKHELPVFCPAFSDCSAGFGLVAHQHAREIRPHVSIDSVKDFHELTKLKIDSQNTGLFMIGGGVPKNFAQDIVVAAELLGSETPMHKYAIQVTVADVRDGGLSGSTLKEACSWGKVETTFEQMVYSEATLAFPLIASYAYHKGSWKSRPTQQLNKQLSSGDKVTP